MFVYATGLAQALRLGCPLYVSTNWFATQSLRALELDSFRLQGVLIDTAPSRLSHSFARVDRRLQGSRLGSLRRSGERVFVERDSRYDERITTIAPNMELSGYFQSWRYFDRCASAIRGEFARIQNPSSWFTETHQELAELGNWTAVHVRRGDYLDPGKTNYHGLADTDYYARSIDLIENQVGDLPLVVFSDEPRIAAEVLQPLGRQLRIIESPPGSRPAESLLLMTGAAAAVIANSSFSWWGAWLAKEGNIVVAPRPWFDDSAFIDRDLLPRSWITISR